MSSLHNQSLVARRLEDLQVEIETSLDYEPVYFQQMAGLIIYYDTNDYVYLRITHHEEKGKCLGILESKHGEFNELLDEDVPLPNNSICKLKATINKQWLFFSYSMDGDIWFRIGGEIDISHLSDEDANYIRFTGTFVGMCAQDLSGEKNHADFDEFIYRALTK